MQHDKKYKYDLLSISSILEHNCALFTTMWYLGEPRFTTEIDTAAISFDQDGGYVSYLFNPDFFASIETNYERAFIVAHEMLHYLLGHGIRMNTILKMIYSKNLDDNVKGQMIAKIANISMDLAVNQLLINHFKFDRNRLNSKVLKSGKKDENGNDELISLKDGLIFPDITFGKDYKSHGIKDNESFEYYQSILCDNEKIQNMEIQYIQLDNHNLMGGLSNDGESDGEGKDDGTDKTSMGKHNLIPKEHFEDFTDDLLKEIMSNLKDQTTKGEMKDIKDKLQGDAGEDKDEGDTSIGGKQAGTLPGRLRKHLELKEVVVKPQWETIVKNWSQKYLDDKWIESWVRKNRRYQSYLERMSEYSLPTEIEDDDLEFNRIRVQFYLDTSGSCAHLADRFFKAAASLPPERFDVELFCFDTRVYETSLESGDLKGFGGTSFKILEQDIQARMKGANTISRKLHHYPEAVFVITDGYGDHIDIASQNRDKWHWFLSENYRHCIPNECNIYDLKDFE